MPSEDDHKQNIWKRKDKMFFGTSKCIPLLNKQTNNPTKPQSCFYLFKEKVCRQNRNWRTSDIQKRINSISRELCCSDITIPLSTMYNVDTLSADCVHPKQSLPRSQTRMSWMLLSLEVPVLFHFLFHCLAMPPAPASHSCITPSVKAELLY